MSTTATTTATTATTANAATAMATAALGETVSTGGTSHRTTIPTVDGRATVRTAATINAASSDTAGL